LFILQPDFVLTSAVFSILMLLGLLFGWGVEGSSSFCDYWMDLVKNSLHSY